MTDRPPKNKVPIEAVLKYIKEDRDKYKEKLEQLVPYTKNLEAQFDELKKAVSETDRNMVWVRVIELKRQVQSLTSLLENEKKKCAKLLDEKTALIHDLHNAKWYKDMQKSHSQTKDEVKRLKTALNHAIAENLQLKQKYEQGADN